MWKYVGQFIQIETPKLKQVLVLKFRANLEEVSNNRCAKFQINPMIP